MIPCKECLKLAICRNKPIIKCSSLMDWRWNHAHVDLEKRDRITAIYLPNISKQVLIRRMGKLEE